MPVHETDSIPPGFDCLLITRPLPEADELASRLEGQLAGLDIQVVVQPAHVFSPADISPGELKSIQAALEGPVPPLLVFTSTRAVHFALRQLPPEWLQRCQLSAIGPATAAALQQAGLESVLQPGEGFRSEDLLRTLDAGPGLPAHAWIVAAAGGRKALLEGLQQRGCNARMLLVYQRQPAAIANDNQQQLERSHRVLSVWTSADAILQLSRGLSAAAWQRVCAGEWLVVSERLAQSAGNSGAAVVHQAAGPGNEQLAAAIEEICRAG